MTTLLAKLNDRTATVLVIGAGYVGLPLAVAFAQAGFRCIAFDKDPRKVAALNQGLSYVGDVPSSELAPLVGSGKLTATDDETAVEKADAVLICVPTPLNKTKMPDLQYVVEATQMIAAHQHADMLVVLESTTYPGTTSDVLVPRLAGERFVLGRDVFIAFSPERVDPANPRWHTRNTPKVIGGATPACQKAAIALYEKVIEQLVPVSSPDAAEMTKLLENTFRQVNIALANEFALMASRLGVDVWEVIDAAATKPFGFMPFYPGPGLGGHCIPIDPLYLSWRMRSFNYQARFIELADQVNSAMPHHVVVLVQQALNGVKRSVNGSRLLVVGVAYKRDVPDHRESPAFEIIAALEKLGADVDYLDPHVPLLDEAGLQHRSVPESVDYVAYDAVIIITDHSAIDYERMVRQSRLVVDTRNVLARTKVLERVPGAREKVVTL
jgi:UDP-N-acetyl-D-glucosamine dehydrogenase